MTTLDLTHERKATPKEKQTAQEVYLLMTQMGYNGTYAGGSKSKGNGFWVRKGEASLGYMNCRQIRKMLAGY